jgi:hypothetical protein
MLVCSAGSAEEDVALSQLAHAEVAARKGDDATVMGHLAQAGKWALEIAKEIGADIAARAIVASMGFE